MMFRDYAINSRSSSDRFIPRRANADFDLSYYYLGKTTDKYSHTFKYSDSDSFVNTAKYFYNLKRYQSELWKTMMPDNKRILDFSSPKKKNKSRKYDNQETPLWPVYPRSKPLIMAPSIILDMPDLDSNITNHVVDWGKKGYIGTIYENEVHLWHPEQKLKRHVTKTNGRVQNCVKWNLEGTHFAMSLNCSNVGIWDCEVCKTTVTITCPCFLKKCNCVVTAMEWTTNNNLITGCSNGRLCSWDSHFICTKTIDMAHLGTIINIKFSCYENYLVTTGVDSLVRVWKWPEFVEHFKIGYSRYPVKALAWHPWKDSLLAIGDPKCTTLWNANTKKELDYKRHPYQDCLVDTMTFNPLSAELVLSYYNFNADGNGVHLLTVLKDLDKIVDEVQFHYGRVPYLLWDSVGTKLATASADENLCIWDFFGTSTATEKKFLHLSKKKEFSTDMLKNLNIFNSCIR